MQYGRWNARMGKISTWLIFAALIAVPNPRSRAQNVASSSEDRFAKISDPILNKPYTDVDEWRDRPVRHRYVHGGFKGTDARFSFYFLPKEKYQGRFFQHITPAPASENLAQDATGAENNIGFSFLNGGYFVETNEGSPSAIAGEQTIPGYRVNAAAAEYSRVLALQMYGGTRPYGYAWGGSGGGFKTIAGFENTDTWDGVVPYVIGSPMAIPNVFTVRLLALRVLKDKFPSIVDAVEPGGNGDMYRGLNEEQIAALREATKMGFPPQTWFDYKDLGEGPFVVLFPIIRMLDHGYFEDFWKVPGYEGANPSPSLLAARIQQKASIKGILHAGEMNDKAGAGGVNTAWQGMKADAPVGYELDNVPAADLEGAILHVRSGKSAGKEFTIGKVVGNSVIVTINPFGGKDQSLTGVEPGDEVLIDNSDILAVQYYHRHQTPPTRDFYVWDQFRDSAGNPLYPQRRMLLGPMVTGTGKIQTGRFKGKMIVIESLMDEDALPWQADWYRTKVKDALGDRLDDNFRLYFTENALHDDRVWQPEPTHTVNYVGELNQALHDVSAWVEKGVPPPLSTNYKVADGQVVVPSAAAERRGIQPVVHLTVQGGSRTEAVVGGNVNFSAIAELPPNTGKIVTAEWSFEGEKTFSNAEEIQSSKQNAFGTRVKLSQKHSFSKPGTYFVVLRVTSQRDGDHATPFGRVQNLGRVRVVVR